MAARRPVPTRVKATASVNHMSILVAVALFGLLAVFPWTGTTFYTELVTKIMIMSIFALSLDLLVGYTGLVSFGHAAFFGIGAYALALLSPKAGPADLWLTLPAAVVVAAIAALIVGVFVLMFFGLFLLWFASGLRERLRAAEGPDGRLADVAFGGAILCAALVWAGGFALAAVPAGISLGGEPSVSNADVARFLSQMGFGSILLGGMFGAFALIVATSIATIRTADMHAGWNTSALSAASPCCSASSSCR